MIRGILGMDLKIAVLDHTLHRHTPIINPPERGAKEKYATL